MTSTTLTPEPTRTAGKRLKMVLTVLIDLIIVGVVLGISATAIIAQWRAGTFRLSLANDPLLSWHLVRAAGMASYALIGSSTVWGMFLSSRFIKDWSPGPVSLLLHATLSWLAVVVAGLHIVLLLADKYYAYTITDLIVPFVGPYRPIPVGLGTAAAWLTLIITISFSLRKKIGQRAWRLLHYTSYIAFIMLTLHALLAGTDASRPGMQLLVGLFTISSALLLSMRIFFKQKSTKLTKAEPVRRATRAG